MHSFTNELKVVFLERCIARQGDLKVGADYQPAIRAVREEAPSICWASRVWYQKYQRWLQVIGMPAMAPVLFALYHPLVHEILEELVIWPDPVSNPLSHYDELAHFKYPGSRGTVKIASEMAALGDIPRCRIIVDNNELLAALPFIADLLVVFRRNDGKLHAVNWTVKSDVNGFKRNLGLNILRRKSQKSIDREERRVKIEERYFAEFGFTTHRITSNTFDRTFIANLREAFGWFGCKPEVGPDVESKILGIFSDLIDTHTAPFRVIPSIIADHGCSRQEVLRIFHMGIWSRRLPVDLFTNVLIDKAIRRGVRDLLNEYDHLFQTTGRQV